MTTHCRIAALTLVLALTGAPHVHAQMSMPAPTTPEEQLAELGELLFRL